MQKTLPADLSLGRDSDANLVRMRWIVEGADKSTGELRTFTASALTREDAALVASAQGLMVSGIQPEQPSIDPLAGMPTRPESESLAGITHESTLPRYAGLRFASTFFQISAFLTFTAAVLWLVVGLVTLPPPSRGASPVLTLIVVFGYALGLIIVGGFQLALAAACDALRDIARNSFRS